MQGPIYPGIPDRITSYNVCYTKLLRKIFPGAIEKCTDSQDNDCDGYIDELDPDDGHVRRVRLHGRPGHQNHLAAELV